MDLTASPSIITPVSTAPLKVRRFIFEIFRYHPQRTSRSTTPDRLEFSTSSAAVRSSSAARAVNRNRKCRGASTTVAYLQVGRAVFIAFDLNIFKFKTRSRLRDGRGGRMNKNTSCGSTVLEPVARRLRLRVPKELCDGYKTLQYGFPNPSRIL